MTAKPKKAQDNDFLKFSKSKNEKTSLYIPGLFYPKVSSKIILYFHGNAEDCALSFDQQQKIGDYLNVNVLAVEYPGYGLYTGNGSANEAKIK